MNILCANMRDPDPTPHAKPCPTQGVLVKKSIQASRESRAPLLLANRSRTPCLSPCEAGYDGPEPADEAVLSVPISPPRLTEFDSST